MIVFNCPCKYTWIISFTQAKIIGPIYGRIDESREPMIFMGNGGKDMSFEKFAEFYSDCYDQLLKKILA